jgi:hypothetical protein
MRRQVATVMPSPGHSLRLPFWAAQLIKIGFLTHWAVHPTLVYAEDRTGCVATKLRSRDVRLCAVERV